MSNIDGKNEITRGLYLQDYARSNQISVEIRNIDTDREGEINLNGAYIGELVEDTQITDSTFNVPGGRGIWSDGSKNLQVNDTVVIED